MTRRTAAVVGALAVLVIGGAAAANAGIGGGGAGGAGPARPPATVPVTRQDLVDSLDATGQLDYGTPVPLRYTPAVPAPDPVGGLPSTAPSAVPRVHPSSSPPAPPVDDDQGLVTWLPALGATISRGGALLRVDNQAVVLLLGALPLYRTLRTGVTGPDVAQFERNLAAMGYGGFTVDNSFSDATAAAVRAWQRAIGRPDTGAVSPGQVVYAPFPIRIAAEPVRVGDPAGGEILDYTGTVRQVTVDLPTAQQEYAAAGTAVTVGRPDGRTLTGRVAGAPVPVQEPDGRPGIRVAVSIADQKALGAAGAATVTVRFTTQVRHDVLTVPVVALVALAEGGYGVQVDEPAGLHYVGVTTGLFADGRVEISSTGLREGTLVVVPR